VTATLDSHVHLWDRSADPQPWIDPATMPALDRDFGPGDLERMLDATGMDAAVVVQSSNSAGETRRLLAHPAPRIAGVVGWIDLTADPARQLDELEAGASRPLVSVRHLVHLDPDPGWLARTAVQAGIGHLGSRGLAFDLVLRWWQLPLATSLAGARADVRFVVDHLGGIAEADDTEAWAGNLRDLSRLPNTWAKLSGLAGLAHRDPDGLRRAVDVALETFGPYRLMYGSDWPLAELGVGAAAWRATAGTLIAELSPAERTAILSATASVAYRLGR
jgi:L-fuconolactonase